MPAAIDLALIADVKLYLGKDGQPIGAFDDALLGQLITAASKFMLQEMGRDALLTTSRQLVFSGKGPAHREFVFRITPVQSVSAVVVGATTVPQATNPLVDAGWFMNTDEYNVQRLTLRCYEFTRGTHNCQITCVTGYTSVPEDVAEACKQLVALRYRERKRIGVTQEGMGNGSNTTYSTKDMTDFMRSIVENYALRA